MAVFHRKKKSRDKVPIKPTADDMKRLLASLSPDAANRLEMIKSPDMQFETVTRWIHADMRRRARKAFAPYIDKKDLREFYAKQISKEDRARLEKLPEEQRRRELARRYFSWRLKNRPPRGSHLPQHGRPHRTDHRPGQSPPRQTSARPRQTPPRRSTATA